MVHRSNPPRFGGGPNRLRLGERLEIAKQRLAEGWTLVAVATHVGYSKASTFSAAFLAVTGERPGAYADRVRAEQAQAEEVPSCG